MTALDEVAATIENLPAVLHALLAPVDAATLVEPPEPGEWSVHEVIGHLITGDGPAFRKRIAGIVNGESEIAPFDPATPMGDRDFNAVGLAALLDELRAERSQSAAYVRSLKSSDLLRTSNYVSQGGQDRQFAAGDFVNEWPFHDHDHLQQILANLKVAHLRAMTETMRRALTGD